MSRIYLAATYGQMEEMCGVAELLKAAGHEITACWIYGDEETQTKQQAALMDLADVARADTVISFTLPPKTFHTGGGRHVEFGYGYSLGKRMILVGQKGEHIFHHLPSIEHFETLAAAIEVL